MIINSILSFEFPPINELLRWKDVVPGLNKVGLIAVAAALIGTLIFLSAARKDPKVAPKGTRNLAEVSVEFIENNIIMQTMGRDGLGWTPFLLTLFLFVYFATCLALFRSFRCQPRREWRYRCSWQFLFGSYSMCKASSIKASSDISRACCFLQECRRRFIFL